MSAINFQLPAGRKLLGSTSALSPTGVDHKVRGASANFVQGSLNSGVAVTLAAMLCALICAIGLGSLIRCANRRIRQRGADASDEVDVAAGNTALAKAAVETLPIVVYTSAAMPSPDTGIDCPICLAEFREGEKVRVLPNCNHFFHMECIDAWLTTQSSCPMCRHSLDLLRENKKPGGAAVAQGTTSNDALQVVTETTHSTLTPPRAELSERSPQDATEATATLALPSHR